MIGDVREGWFVNQMHASSTAWRVSSLLLLWLALPAWAGIFDVQGKRPQRVELLTSDASTPIDENASAMEQTLAGVGYLLSTEEITKLRTLAGSTKPAAMPKDATRIATLQLFASETTRTVELWHAGTGDFFARATDDDEGSGVRLDTRKTEALGQPWPRYRGGFEVKAAAIPVTAVADGKVMPLPKPMLPAWLTVDEDQLSERYVRGRDTKNPGTNRSLSEAHALVRLPKGYNPRIACGLLVFVHAAPEAAIPEAIMPVADELGFICVAAGNVGNDQVVANRLQRTLDAVETIQARYLIDTSRVYFTGISGGGKISTHAWFGFPEIVKGAIPVVATSIYENLRRSDGKYYQGDYPRPNARRFDQLRAHRLACITGEKDMNYEHITLAIKLMLRDRLDVKLFDVPGMGHEFAKSTDFAQALRWIDEPNRSALDVSIAEASKLLDEAKLAKTTSKEQAKLLARRAMDAAPWTPIAWDALAFVSELH